MKTRTLTVLIIITATLFLAKGEIFFEFHSDPPNSAVDMGQSAAYHCSVNDTRISIAWNIDESNVIPTDIDVVGTGTSSSNLTIPGLDEYNNTIVRCIATGLVNGNIYYNFSESTLRVQSALAQVINLLCIQEENGDCIKCDWEAPFSLTPIPSYAINVTRTSDVSNSDEPVTLRNSSTTTTYSFCPEQYGQYSVSVAANNNAGLGNMSFEIVESNPNTKWRNVRVLTRSTNVKGYWNLTFEASTTSFLAGGYEIIPHFSDSTNATGNAEVDDQGQVTGTMRTGRLDKGKWIIRISLKYASNRSISEPVEIDTFGVRRQNVTVKGLKLCVEAEFVEGSDTKECLVEYRCSSYQSRGSINITRENPRNCTEDVDPNNYTMTFYDDLKEPNRIVAVEHAIVGNIPEEESTIILPSSSIGLPSSSGTPDSTDPSNADDSLPTAVIIVVLFVIVIIIIILTIMTFIVLKKKKKKPEVLHIEAEDTGHHKCSRNSVLYLETEVSSDRPRAPPTVEEKVQYTKVESQGDALYSLPIPITENYSVATQNILENPTNSEYSRLNSRGYKSPHQPEPACNDTKEMYSTIPLAHGNMNKEFSYAVLAKYVAPHISHKWEELGLALALTPDDIEQLKENHQGINDVFLFWEQQQTRPFTWETLIMALKSINEYELVNKL